jgi:hypothetical protein
MAFPWWNAAVGDCAGLKDPPQPISVERAAAVFPRICPYLHHRVPAHADWESVLGVVQEFAAGDVPHPLHNFPLFVSALYSLRSIFAPKTASDCLRLLDNGGFKPLSFVYECPRFVLDPLVFYRVLLALRDQRLRAWRALATVPGVLEALFEVHAGALQPMPPGSSAEVCEHRLYVAELLHSLLRENAKNHARIAPLIARFVDSAIRLIATAPLELAATLLRYILPFVRKMHAKGEKDHAHSFAWHLLRVLDQSDSPLFLMTIKFLLQLSPAAISAACVIKMIATRGIRSLSDITVVSLLADAKTVVPALTFFCRSALLRKLWHRACVDRIRALLLNFSARAEVRDFFGVFIRRLFVFVALSTKHKSRYGGRAVLVCESLASFSSIKLLWLQHLLTPGASSVVATKSYPAYFKAFFPLMTPVDNTILQEYEAFLSSNVPLKTFPFDVARGTLLSPPLIEPLIQLTVQRACLTQRSARHVALKRPVQKKRSVIHKPGRLTHSRSLVGPLFPPLDRR